MTSRERMLASISNQPSDYVPCAFMIFGAMRGRSRDDLDFITRQVDLGLYTVVELTTWGTGAGPDHPDPPGPPLRFHPGTEVVEWVEDVPEGRLIHRRYDTPAGPLTASIRWTDDWKAGPRVPLMDDWVIPRADKFLVQTDEDLDRLPFILAPVGDEARAQLSEMAEAKKALAQEKQLLVAGGLGVGLEAAAWLCGYEAVVWAAIDRPKWLERLVTIVHDWNVSRMEALLDLGVDIFIRRAWYEGSDFLSPAIFRRFVLPSLKHEKHEVDLAHDAGAKFGYINTGGSMPILDMLMEAGVDVLIGVDPVQGKGTDLAEMRRSAGRRLAVWGGVNGFITVERGGPEVVREAVRAAMAVLGPVGFILSPADNVTGASDRVWANVEALIDEWRRLR